MEKTRAYTALPHEYLEEMEELSHEEYGRLIRILQHYSQTGEILPCSGNERFFLKRVINREDRYQKEFHKLTEQRSQNGRKGAMKRWGTVEETGEADFRNPSKESEHRDEADAPTGDHGKAMATDSKNGYTNAEAKANSNSDTEEVAVATSAPEGLTAPSATKKEDFVNLACRRLGIELSRHSAKELRSLYHKLGFELCMYAVDRCFEEGKKTWSYLRGILRGMVKGEVRNVEEDILQGQRLSPGKEKSVKDDGFQRHGQTQCTAMERETIRMLIKEGFLEGEYGGE